MPEYKCELLPWWRGILCRRVGHTCDGRRYIDNGCRLLLQEQEQEQEQEQQQQWKAVHHADGAREIYGYFPHDILKARRVVLQVYQPQLTCIVDDDVQFRKFSGDIAV